MPFPRTAVRDTLTVVGIGTAAALLLTMTWVKMKSPSWTILCCILLALLSKALEAHRRLRRRQQLLPTHLLYPGSTAV